MTKTTNNKGDKMITKVYPNIYKQEIPLPRNPLRILNSYIILGESRNLIIDTGFNMKECKEAFMDNIEELNIDLTKTDLLITHLHSDHSGLAAEVSKKGAGLYAGKIDGPMMLAMTKDEYWKRFEGYTRIFDLEKDNLLFHDHPGYKYCPKEALEFNLLKEGDLLEVGDYAFEVIDIPGHTPGHIGLYERNHRLFFGGDHILDRITPNISFWGFEYNILETYLNSLKKVYEYDIDYLFTAHRNILRDHKRRIDELLQHHGKRLDEIRSIIKNKRMSVRDTAANMHWELRYDSWDDFPNPQKWFASSEAMSHLEYLFLAGEAERSEEEGILYYKL